MSILQKHFACNGLSLKGRQASDFQFELRQVLGNIKERLNMKLALIEIGKFIALAELQLMELLGNNRQEFKVRIFLFAWKVYLARALFRGSWNEA